jgi:hypothetical protein
MITSLIFFVLSGLFAGYMFWGRRGADNYDYENEGEERAGGTTDAATVGKEMSECRTDLDIRLRSAWNRSLTQIRAMNWEYIQEKMHALAEYIEKKALVIVSKVFNRFGRVRDVVTGKDLPKNKGSVSFFLKHIEHHRNQILEDKRIRDEKRAETRMLEINRD